MDRSVRTWMLAALLVSALAAEAQTTAGQDCPAPELLRFRHVTVADGLPQSDVVALHQDSLGFLWAGTEDGLGRYDGRDVRAFKPLAFDTTGLPSPRVTGLASAGGAGLWVATTAGGLAHYDAAREAFASHPLDEAAETDDDLLTLMKARDGSLWVGLRYHGLRHYDPRARQTMAYPTGGPDPEGLSDGRVLSLLEDRQGRIWVGTDLGGLHRLDPATGRWRRWRQVPGQSNTLPADRVSALLQSRDGTLWVGTTPGGLSRYRPDTDDFVPAGAGPCALGDAYVHSLMEDAEGVIWIGTDDGLARRDPITGAVARYRHDPAAPASVGPGAVRAMLLDRTGVFWLGTEGGLSAFVHRRPPFRHLAAGPRGLDHPDVWSAYEDRDGTLWVGTLTGLNRVDRANGAVTTYPVRPLGTDDPGALVGAEVMGLYEDRAGRFWVGTRTGALHRFDREAGRVAERFPYDPDAPERGATDTPWAFLERDDGTLWVTSGGRGCLSLFDPDAGTFDPLCHDPENDETPAHDIAHDLVRDPSGVLWLGTWGGGLDRIDPATDAVTHLRHDPADPNTPASDFLIALHQSADGALWLGTYGAGLDRYDPTTGAFDHLTEATSDLPNDIILAIEEDASGSLWVSTYQGIARVTRRPDGSYQFQTYGLEEGLQDLEFNSGASVRTPSGALAFGGINGLTSFAPGEIRPDPAAPPVVLTRLRVRGQPAEPGGEVLDRSLPFTEVVTLRPNERDLSLSFAALHYADPTRNRYRYRLEGYDDVWQVPGPEQTATYTNLDPGRYTFRVQAANPDGVWNEDGATLMVVIRPPWWRSWPAYLAYGLAFLAAVAGVDRAQRRRLAAQERERAHAREVEHAREIERAYTELQATKDRLVQHEKMASLGALTAGIAHEIKNPLNFVTNFAGLSVELVDELADETDPDERRAILDDLRGNARKIKEHGHRADAIVRSMMDHARNTSGARQEVDLNALVGEHVGHAVHAHRARHPEAEAAVRIELGDGVGRLSVAPQEIGRVVVNLVDNALDAVRTGPDGDAAPAVTVTTRRTGDAVEIGVADTGPGLAPEVAARVFEPFFTTKPTGEGTGLGLSMSYDIVTQGHGGTLTVESVEGEGATFVLRLPADPAPTADDDRSGPPASDGASRDTA